MIWAFHRYIWPCQTIGTISGVNARCQDETGVSGERRPLDNCVRCTISTVLTLQVQYRPGQCGFTLGTERAVLVLDYSITVID